MRHETVSSAPGHPFRTRHSGARVQTSSDLCAVGGDPEAIGRRGVELANSLKQG
jgi:hypothetical protein